VAGTGPGASKIAQDCGGRRRVLGSRFGGIAIIAFEQVTKVYPPRTVALADVTLEIARGEFVFLIGPSGAGKSTLIRLIYREEKPSAGRLLIDGRDVGRLRRREIPFLRRRIGVVFQDFKLLPHKTVWENVAFPLVVTETRSRDIRRRVPQILELVGLADKARARASELSGGEQQRCAIARAAVTDPDILIADEPTGNLDPRTARGVIELLLELNRRGTTTLVATHSETLVNALRRRVITLEGGRVVRDEARGGYQTLGPEGATRPLRAWAPEPPAGGSPASAAEPGGGRGA
jgi:cell division transport system ATP-binding protein